MTIVDTTMDKLSLALLLAQEGHEVFPIPGIINGMCRCPLGADCPEKRRGKHPWATSNGFYDATRDLEQINKWWTDNPTMNIGIRTGGESFVLDVDPRNGGEESLAALIDKIGPFPVTRVVNTGGGGRHFYFLTPEGVTIRSNSGTKLGPGLDIKGDRAYAIGEGSDHVSGGRYERASDDRMDFAPQALIDLLTAPNAKANKDSGVRVETGEGVILDGSRNSTLTSDAGAMRRRGMEHDAILAALMVTNAKRCSPPLADQEVAGVAKSVMRYSPADPALGRMTKVGTPLPKSKASTVALADVVREATRWMWPDWIAYEKVNLIEGDPDVGKSTLALDIAARVSTGRPMPDGSGGGDPGVVILTAYVEDGLKDTIGPRVDAAGGDDTKIHALKMTGVDGSPRLFTIPDDIAELEREVREKGAKFVVVDALMATFSEDTNSYKDQDVRRALHPLAELAERTGVAIVAIRHFRKGEGSPINKGGGSVAIGGVARSTLQVYKDPEEQSKRIVVLSKHNVAPDKSSLKYSFESVNVGTDAVSGLPITAARLKWHGTSSATAQSLSRSSKDRERDDENRDAQEFIIATLAFVKERDSKDIKRAALAEDHTWRTVQRAAKDLKVNYRKEGFPPTVWWSLPDGAREAAEEAKEEAAEGVTKSAAAPFAPTSDGEDSTDPLGANGETRSPSGISGEGDSHPRQYSNVGANGAGDPSEGVSQARPIPSPGEAPEELALLRSIFDTPSEGEES